MGRPTFALLAFVACAPVVEEPPAQEVASRRRIAPGRFGSPGIDGSWDEGGFVLALADPDEDGGTLSVFPWDGGAPCEVGRVAEYRTFGVAFDRGSVLSDDPVRIETSDAPWRWESARIGHADAACGVQAPLIDEPLREPPIRDFSAPWRAFFAWTVFGDLWRIDPWAGESTRLARNVTHAVASWYGDGGDASIFLLWFVSDGVLHAANSGGEVTVDLGRDVREIATGCPVVWNEGGAAELWGGCLSPQVAFIDADGLWRYDGREARALAEAPVDACDLAWWTGNANDPYVDVSVPPVLTYVSCDRRSVHVRDLSAARPPGTYDADVRTASSVGAVQRLPSGAIAYVLADSAETTIGDAYVVLPGSNDTEFIAERADLASIRSIFGQTILLAEHDGERGTLGGFAPGFGFLAAPGFGPVAEFSLQGLLAVLEADGTLSVRDPLALLPGGSGPEDRGQGEPYLVAEGVPPGGLRWSPTTWALDYLEEFTPGAGGTLRTWIVPDDVGGGDGGPGPGEPRTGERGFVVDEGVLEWREIRWPDAGALYAVGSGEREGIWYADWVE